jgi:hypothetical protein
MILLVDYACSAEGELDAERTARLQILHQLLLGAGCSGEYVHMLWIKIKHLKVGR